MEFSYKNHKLERLLSEEDRAQRKFGEVEAKRLFEMLGELRDAPRLGDFSGGLRRGTRWDPHEFKGGKQRGLAFKFSRRLRLVVLRGKGQEDKDWEEVTAIEFVFVADYHSGKGRQLKL